MDRTAIEQTETISMDRESVEKLLRQIPEALMDRKCDKICREKQSKGLDIQLFVESCRDGQKQFFNEEENTDMNAIKHVTQSKIQTTYLIGQECIDPFGNLIN